MHDDAVANLAMLLLVQRTLTTLAIIAGVAWIFGELIEAWRLTFARKCLEMASEHQLALDDAACDEITLAARELTNGETFHARQRLERLLDDVSPDWRTWGGTVSGIDDIAGSAIAVAAIAGLVLNLAALALALRNRKVRKGEE